MGWDATSSAAPHSLTTVTWSDGKHEPATVQALRSNLKMLRNARGMTQADLARATGITREHYRLLEAGEASSGGPANPRLATLDALAGVLGVSASTLLITPSPHTVFRWSELPHPPDWDVQEKVLAALLEAAGAQGGEEAAFIASDDTTLTMGICVLAADPECAVIISEPLLIRALQHAGLPPRLTTDLEVSQGRDSGLVSID